MNSFGESAVYPAMGNNKSASDYSSCKSGGHIFSFAHEVRNLPACRTIEKWARIGKRGIAITKSCNDRAKSTIPFSAR